MVNQLIQKKDRPPIIKLESQVVYETNILVEKKLQDGFTSLDYQRGLKNINSLKVEYDNLAKLYINRDSIGSLVNIDRIKKLTDSLYYQGLQFLDNTLSLVQQLAVTDVGNIASETGELEGQLESCNDVLKPIITERIAKNKKAMATIKEYNDRIDETLSQAGLCKDSIREIRLELPELLTYKSKDEYDKVVFELNTRIDFAQRVKEAYIKEGI
jgi:hypothetical protein